MLTAVPWAFPTVIGILGLLVGSFLNVVIYRLPIMLERQWRDECAAFATPDSETPATPEKFNLMVPRSRCPQCQTMITAGDNIPVLSYLWLRGRCRHCQVPIPRRYPLIELVSGALGTLAAAHFGAGWSGLFAAILTWALLALAVIDFDTQLLPDVITLPILWLGLLVNSAGVFVDLQASVFGAALGYSLLWSVFWLFKLATGKDGMGFGDFKLLAMLGAWLGWQRLPIVLLGASLVGAVVGLALIALAGRAKEKPIPFGPYLACAGWVAMLWGEPITAYWLGLSVGGGL